MRVLGLHPVDQLGHVDQLAHPLTDHGHRLDVDQVAVVGRLRHQEGSEADELAIPRSATGPLRCIANQASRGSSSSC
jgi:hypothetical protein